MLIGGGIGYYLFNMPHRHVQEAKSDYSLSASEIVNEYLTNKDAANVKYLADNGESKILQITGEVSQITDGFDGEKIVLLKNAADKAGVSATFSADIRYNKCWSNRYH